MTRTEALKLTRESIIKFGLFGQERYAKFLSVTPTGNIRLRMVDHSGPADLQEVPCRLVELLLEMKPEVSNVVPLFARRRS
jgi:hypothetical protein